MAQHVVAPDGVRLAVREFGDPTAPTIVCVHGYPDNQTVWDDVAALLAARFRVVTYDVRGAGESEAPRTRSAYELDRLEADLATVIDTVSPHAPVHLVGHDWGSIQGWHAATGCLLDGRIASFTSMSGPCLDHVAHWFRSAAHQPTPVALAQRARQAAMSIYIGFFRIPLLPELAWRTGAMPRVIELINRFDPGITDPSRHRPAIADGINGLELYRANMLSRLRSPRPRRATVPVQILAPSGDPFVSTALQESARDWTTRLWLHRVRGGHWLPLSAPAEVARHTAALIERPGCPPVRDRGIPTSIWVALRMDRARRFRQAQYHARPSHNRTPARGTHANTARIRGPRSRRNGHTDPALGRHWTDRSSEYHTVRLRVRPGIRVAVFHRCHRRRHSGFRRSRHAPASTRDIGSAVAWQRGAGIGVLSTRRGVPHDALRATDALGADSPLRCRCRVLLCPPRGVAARHQVARHRNTHRPCSRAVP